MLSPQNGTAVLKGLKTKMHDSNRSGEGGRRACPMCDPGSEFRLIRGREKTRAIEKNETENNELEYTARLDVTSPLVFV